jgi:hypothetical protein
VSGGGGGECQPDQMKALHIFLIFYLFFEVDLDQHARHLCCGLCWRMDHNACAIGINVRGNVTNSRGFFHLRPSVDEGEII